MWLILVLGVVVGVVAVDQVSKILVLQYLYEDKVTLIPGVLDFTYVENRGMAFGLLADHRWVFMVFSVLGIGLLAFYLIRYVKSTWGRIGLSLIIGGGIGNMIDRVAYGFVVDFIDFYAFDFWKWVFNVADSAVCVGAAIFIIDMIVELVGEYKKTNNGSGNSDTKQAENVTDEEKNDGTEA